MARVSFKELAPEVLSVAAACPVPTIVRTLRATAIDLAQRTECMRFMIPKTYAPAGSATVEIPVPCDMVLVAPQRLTTGGGDYLEPISLGLLEGDMADLDTVGTPTNWIRSSNSINQIILYPCPATDVYLTGQVAVKPSRDAQEIEEIYLDRYQQILVDGALARLLAVPSAPWYDGKVAAYHKSVYESQLDEARQVAEMDDVPKRRVMKYGGI